MCTKVSKTAELYAYIFSFADDQTLAKCARVCMDWTDTALDILWADMSTISPLFRVLGPMKVYTKGEYRYVNNRPHSTENWTRLMTYGRRIKKLEIFEMDLEILSQRAMQELALRRPTMSLTPNLQHLSLSWSEDRDENEGHDFPPERIFDICFLICHENVQSLSLDLLYFEWTTFLEGIWASVFQKTMGLRKLKIEGTVPIDDINDFFVKMVPRLQSLESVSLPAGALTPRLSKLFNSSTNLKKIIMVLGMPCTPMHDLPENPFVQSSRPSSLEELQVQTLFPYATSSLNDKYYPNLISLQIRSVAGSEDSKSLARLLECLSSALPSLRKLSVDFVHKSSKQLAEDVSCEHLQTLSSMKQLKAFSLQWPTPLKCTNKDLSELLLKMPHIEELNLNSCPVNFEAGAGLELTLDILPYIAQHCRELKRLALFLDCTISPSLNNPLSNCYLGRDDHWDYTFSNLKYLDLGVSPVIRDQTGLAMRLSRVVPPYCKFLSGETLRKYAYDAWPGICHEVGRLTRMLSAARREELRKAEVRVDRLVEKRIQELERGTKPERSHAS